jgi:hypothetical protein
MNKNSGGAAFVTMMQAANFEQFSDPPQLVQAERRDGWAGLS